MSNDSLQSCVWYHGHPRCRPEDSAAKVKDFGNNWLDFIEKLQKTAYYKE